MKNYKGLSLLYFVSAATCIIAAILFYSESDSAGMGTLWLILGCFNICMLSINIRESKKDSDDKK